ncbi:MAG TPA: hypothetical protein VHV78_01655 [Gemmatimonadaceae bacterium]|nr:hypothetical protein [Gemmatimonadaceae bacterium]
MGAGASFEPLAALVAATGIHVYESRTFEHGTDRTFELDLIGETMQFDSLVDQLRRRPDVVGIATE